MVSLVPHDDLGVIRRDPAVDVGAGADILVVDDDDANLVACEAALAPLGRRVVVARSGGEALAKLLEQDFALVLLDVAMPEMTGFETARVARSRPRNHGTPIVFIASAASSCEMLEGYDAGGFDFVVTPIAPELLRAKVRVYLQLQAWTQELLHNVHRLAQTQRPVGAERRLETLRAFMATLARATTLDDVAEAIVQRGTEAVEASGAGLWLGDGAEAVELVASHRITDEHVADWHHVATRMLATGEPHAPDDETFAALTIASQTRGVLCFAYPHDHRFTGEERAFLAVLVQACEHALDRVRLHEIESRARQHAEEANQRKDQYLAMLGHELRNPLAAMTSALELIRVREGEVGFELSVVERQLRHLTHLVDDLVDASRLTHGRIALRREAVDVAAAIAEAIDLVPPLVSRNRPCLQISAPRGLLVDADRHRLVQVLANLLSNAARFVARPGHIEVSATREHERVCIVVRDDGIGIAPELLPRVFDAFVQGAQPLHRPHGGLGIGLTIARMLVQLHGGEVHAASDGVGRGSTFRVLWPSARSPSVRAPVDAEPACVRALVVDDNEDAATLFAALIEELGHRAAIAHDAPTALRIAASFSPTVAFLAVGPRKLDGVDLGRRLRELPACAATTLVALTSYDDDHRASEGAGFRHQFAKPIELPALTALLATVAKS